MLRLLMTKEQLKELEKNTDWSKSLELDKVTLTQEEIDLYLEAEE